MPEHTDLAIRVARAAVNLISRCPPRRSRQNMLLVAGAASHLLLGDGANTAAGDAFRQELVDQMVQRVDESVQTLNCPRCDARIIACEYNRDGDTYRCPRCNGWTDAFTGEWSASRSTTRVVAVGSPAWYVRSFEVALNSVFGLYARQYYANREAQDDRVVACAFAWLVNSGEDDGVNEGCDPDDSETWSPPNVPIGFAIHLLHRHRGDPANSVRSGQWLSTHHGSVVIDRDGSRGSAALHWSVRSTFLVDMTTAQLISHHRVHGLVAQETQSFSTKIKGSATSLFGADAFCRHWCIPMVTALGERVQKVENAVRDSVESVYFGKACSMLAYALRRYDDGQARASAAASAEVDRSPPAPGQHSVEGNTKPDAAAADARASAEKGQSSVEAAVIPPGDGGGGGEGEWEAYQDEEGNTYYYNAVTGATSWEAPTATAADATAAVAGSPTGSSPTVMEILESLSLSQPADEYHRALKRYLKQFYNLKLTQETLLQLDAAEFTLGEGDDGMAGEQRQVLEVLVPVFGDRRKILKWIQRTRGA